MVLNAFVLGDLRQVKMVEDISVQPLSLAVVHQLIIFFSIYNSVVEVHCVVAYCSCCLGWMHISVVKSVVFFALVHGCTGLWLLCGGLGLVASRGRALGDARLLDRHESTGSV